MMIAAKSEIDRPSTAELKPDRILFVPGALLSPGLDDAGAGGPNARTFRLYEQSFALMFLDVACAGFGGLGHEV
jgi:hypothetical protein